MRESGDEKSTLRQIEKIKALSEDMLEYQAIDVHKAWQSMERRAKRKASMRMFSLFFTRAAAILVVPLLISSLFFLIYIIPQVGMLRRGHLWFLRRLVPCLVQLPVWCYLINLLFG